LLLGKPILRGYEIEKSLKFSSLRKKPAHGLKGMTVKEVWEKGGRL